MVLNKNESCDNVEMAKIKMSDYQAAFPVLLWLALMRIDETKLSKGKFRQNLRNSYAVVRFVKKWTSLYGVPLHLSYLNLNWTEHAKVGVTDKIFQFI